MHSLIRLLPMMFVSVFLHIWLLCSITWVSQWMPISTHFVKCFVLCLMLIKQMFLWLYCRVPVWCYSLPVTDFVDGAPALLNTQTYWIISENSALTWKVTFLIFFSNSLFSSVVFHAYMNEAFESTLQLPTEDIVYTIEDNFYARINSQWPSKLTTFQVCRWKCWGIATRDTH